MPTPTDAFLGLSLSAAQNLNIVNGVPTLQQESLSATNRQDIYRWNLSSRSSLNLSLSNLSGNVNVGIGIDVNQNGIVDSADQFWQSSRDGIGNEKIQLELLEAGTYYVVVNSVDSVSTGYDLRITTQTKQQTDILWRNLTNSTLGYWQFEGLQYIGSKQIPTPVGGEWTIEGIGDFNGDINEDILWRERSTGKMAVWLMANGTYTEALFLNNVVVTADWQVKGVADIDLDGKADVVWHNPTSGDVYLWKMDGANRVSDKLLAQSLVGNAWTLEKVADFNGDRTGDLLWRHQQTGDLHLWGITGFAIDGNKTHVVGQVNGQGQFTALQIPASTGWKIEGAGDFTGDGKADLLWRNSQGQIAVWAMDGWKVQSSLIWQGVVADFGWQLVGIDDFSGDGKTDALWQHQSTGDLVIWQMNGTQTPMGGTVVNPSQGGQIKAIGTAVRPVVWDEAGDTWALATGLGTLNGSGRQVGTLNGWDRDDFYRFSLSAATPIGLWLHDLTGNAELQLLDSAGQVLASSTLGLGLDEVIQRSLAAGTYGIRVFHNETNAQMAYQLDWTTTPSQVSFGSGMQLALASDTGISNSDGITNQASVTVQGTGQAGSVVTVRDQTQQVLGQTRIGANGQWQLQLAELADGSYGLTAQVTNPWGYSTTGNALAITIDTVAPNQVISGILNGITWQSSDQIQATITDLGVGLANVTYQLDNQTPQTWTGNNGQWSKSVSNLLNWNDPSQQGIHTLTLRSLDRAGNLQTEQYSFSVPKPFTWADTDLWIGSTDPNAPNTSGDNLVAPPLGGSGGQSGGSGLAQYGWGADGYWGYWYGGQWSRSPYNTPEGVLNDPQWFPANGNPGSSNTYRSRLRSILTTALAAIPTDSAANQAKKAALKNRINLLIEAGAYLQGDADDRIGFGYEGGAAFTGAWLDQFFQGSLVKAKYSSANLNQIGLALAKELVTNPESVRLLTFQTLVETVVGAAHLQTNWFGAQQTQQIQQAARELARSYGLLKPQGTGLTGTFGWLDQLWDMADSGLSDGNAIRTILHGNTKAAGIVGNVVQMLNGLGNGDGDWYDLQLWRISRSLVQAGMQVSQWRDAVQTVEFVEALLNLGYSLVQVHPTVEATNGTEVANWVETLLEQGDIRIAAAGLSEFLSGIEPLPEKVKALQYAGRLVKVADAVDDPTLDQQVLKAEFLSHLMNSGSAYSALGENTSNLTLTDPSYLLLASQNDIAGAANALEQQIQDALQKLNTQYVKETIVQLRSDGKMSAGGSYWESPGSRFQISYLNGTPENLTDDVFPISYRILRKNGSLEAPLPGDTWFKFYNQVPSVGPLDPVGLYPGDVVQYPAGNGQPDNLNFKRVTNLNPIEKGLKAVQFAPSLLTEQVKSTLGELYKAATDWRGALAFGGFLAAQATPVGPILNIALILLGGLQVGLSFGSFLQKSWNAQSQSDLWDAARDFNNTFINLAGLVGTPSALLKLELSAGSSLVNTTKWLAALNKLHSLFSSSIKSKTSISLSGALSTIFAAFADEGTSVGKLIKYGDGVTQFLANSLGNNLSTKGLQEFAKRLATVFNVADKLEQSSNPVILQVAKQNPVSLEGLLKIADQLEPNLLERLFQLDQTQAITDLFQAMARSESTSARIGVIDVLTKYLKDLPKQPQNQTFTASGFASFAADLNSFLMKYPGKVSGEFASRFRRIHQSNGDVAAAQAEIRLAEDLIQGRTLLGSGKVEGVQEIPDRPNPEFLFHGSDGSKRAIEVKTLTTPQLDKLSNRLSEADQQLVALSHVTNKGGLIRINSTANPPQWSTGELYTAIEDWFRRDPQRVAEFVEVIYYDDAGVLRKSTFQNKNGQVIQF